MSSLVFRTECQTFLLTLSQRHWPLGYSGFQLLWGVRPSQMTPLSLFVPRDLCASGVPSTCSCFSSAAEKVLGSFEDLSGCVASDQMVGGFCKVGLGAISLSLPNTDLLGRSTSPRPHQENTGLSASPEGTLKHQEAKQQKQGGTML